MITALTQCGLEVNYDYIKSLFYKSIILKVVKWQH